METTESHSETMKTFKDVHQLIMSLIAPLKRNYHCSEQCAAEIEEAVQTSQYSILFSDKAHIFPRLIEAMPEDKRLKAIWQFCMFQALIEMSSKTE